MRGKTVFFGLLIAIFGTVTAQTAPAAPPTCYNVAARVTHDYAYLIGSADFLDPDGDLESGSTFRWLINDAPSVAETVAEGLLLHFDGSVEGGNGETPNQAQGINYATGKWGSALALAPTGHLSFGREGNLHLDEGTIEMWVAMRADGDDPLYSSQSHVLFDYQAPNGDWLQIAQAGDTGILYGGGVVGGEWQSAYGPSASTREWQAYDWHHLSLTYSASESAMRFYVDGVLTADTNEGHYWPPSEGGESFNIGHAAWGGLAHYLIDEVRFSGRVATSEEIAARAQRLVQPRANEVWLTTDHLEIGDTVIFEYTPATSSETGSSCLSPPNVYSGIPITDPRPPSTLLPPGSTEFSLSVDTTENTSCAYAVGVPIEYDVMTPFDQGAGTAFHQTVISGLDPDANVVNEVYVRCASCPDYVLHLQYRSLSSVNPSYPRTGNLWGAWGGLAKRDLPYIARMDLLLGADWLNSEQMASLRTLNPDILILTSINTVLPFVSVPDDYFLKDVDGNKIEAWPGMYYLNLTKDYVAEFQAQYAYQTLLDSGMMADGVFFDNVFISISFRAHELYGNPIQIDSDEDGQPDDPETLDVAWKAGVFHEINTFRSLAPNAILSGHAMDMDINEPGIADLFNGISFGFWTADVIQGDRDFSVIWTLYNDWMNKVKAPAITMFESSPLDEIAYGYGYDPASGTVPTSTLDFARTYYPWMRFGLALTLLDDGYFAHEFGDTWHGNDWWYDELDFYLGYPLGSAEQVDSGVPSPVNQIENGDFEDPIEDPWDLRVNSETDSEATLTQDTGDAISGTASARIDVAAASGTNWHIEFAQRDRSLTEGVSYALTFWARSDESRNITLSAQKDAPDWDNYGLWQDVNINTEWQPYTVTFMANATVTDSRIQFWIGETTGTVWLDDVRLTEHPPAVYRREFTHGMVLLNATQESQAIDLEPGYRRGLGEQAALYETILDDADPHFSTIGDWTVCAYDSGQWQVSGPFYHDWGEGCHERTGNSGEARWDLPITASDTYTLTAWWPAATESVEWNQNATYEVIAGGQVVASTSLDQRTGGDEWHLVAEVGLDPNDEPYVRLTCPGDAPCIADALHIRSRARYNDGSPTELVTLEPLDGIVLLRRLENEIFLPFVSLAQEVPVTSFKRD